MPLLQSAADFKASPHAADCRRLLPMGSVCSGAHRWVIFLSILGTLGAKIVTVGSFVAHFGSPWSKRVENGVTCWSMLGTLGCKMVPSESFFGVFGGPWSKNGANWVPNLRFADFLRLSGNVCFRALRKALVFVSTLSRANLLVMRFADLRKH